MLQVCAVLVGWAVGVGLDWLPGLSGESWNGSDGRGCRRCPTIATSWAMVQRVRSLEILGLSQRCRGFVDGRCVDARYKAEL